MEQVKAITLQGNCCNFSACPLSCRVDGIGGSTSIKFFIILCIINILNVLQLLSKVGHPSISTYQTCLLHIELQIFGSFVLHVHYINSMVTKLHRHILISDEQASK